jgi:ABC-2 type transport system permease protein
VLGAALRFLLSYSCGLLAFWVTKVAAVYGVIDVISLFLSGRIAPLEMLPPQLREWSEWLPFRYMISFPIEIATGAVRAEELVRGFAIAAGWLFVLAAVLQWLWKAGMKKNQAVGG